MNDTDSDGQGRRLAELRIARGLTQEMLAEAIGVDPGTLARWERGAQRIRYRNEAALAQALGVELIELRPARAGGSVSSAGSVVDRDLRVVEFVSWLAANSDKSYGDAYQAVVAAADRIEASPHSKKHTKRHTRAVVTREDLVAAVKSYYDIEESGHQLYRATVAGREIELGILVEPEWVGLNVDLRGDGERASFTDVRPPKAILNEAAFQSAATRLADAEINNRVLINNPLYRLMSVAVRGDVLESEFALAEFADYALRDGLMEVELVDEIVASDDAGQPGRWKTPVRDALLPSVDVALDFKSRFCTGGPVCLLAVARPADIARPADYALFIQARGKQVMDIAGKLSTIPKGWHQPIGEPSSQARLGLTLLRELEEELFGRDDLEQRSVESQRTADLLHDQYHPEALKSLLADGSSFRIICTGFGINLLSGAYEVPSLIVIEDETWWKTWGHLIAGNWEAMRIDCYSTMDTAGLTTLAHDPRWSNEGLLAFLEGLSRLSMFGDNKRVAIPDIERIS